MKYQLQISSVEGVKRRYSEFSETESVRGNVVVTFETGRESRDWLIKDANIPLFLSNLLHFLRQVEMNGDAVFTAQFSPNSNGRMNQGTLLLSTTSGTAFDKGIYDETSPRKLDVLKKKLIIDGDRFGIFSAAAAPEPKLR